jgi:small-conductance mechanosensitive channel
MMALLRWILVVVTFALALSTGPLAAAETSATAPLGTDAIVADAVVQPMADATPVAAGARIEKALAASMQRLWRMLGMLPLLLLGLLVAWLFWRVGGWLGRRRIVASRLSRRPFLAGLLSQAIRLALTVIGVLIALEMLDATSLAAALLGSAGVLGIALGFAFRDLLENYIASVLLSLRQPFAPDDSVVIDGYEGVVVGMNSRATVLMTPDGNHLRLPNAQVFKSVTLNYTRNGKRRFDFVMTLPPASDVAEAMQAVAAAVRATPDVLPDPKPSVELAAATREGWDLKVFGWVDQRTGNFFAARSEALRRSLVQLSTAGFDLGPRVYRVAPVEAEAPRESRTADTVPELPQKDCSAVEEAVERTRAEMAGTDLLKKDGTPE